MLKINNRMEFRLSEGVDLPPEMRRHLAICAAKDAELSTSTDDSYAKRSRYAMNILRFCRRLKF